MIELKKVLFTKNNRKMFFVENVCVFYTDYMFAVSDESMNIFSFLFKFLWKKNLSGVYMNKVS